MSSSSATKGKTALVFGKRYEVSEIAGVTQSDIELLRIEMTSTPIEDDIYELLNKYRYIGLDLSLIRAHFVQLGRDNGWDASVLVRKCLELVGLALMKGSVTSNNFSKMDADGQMAAVALIKECRIEGKISADNKLTGVTLGRVLLAFPREACKMAVHLGKDHKEGPAGSALNGIPGFMKCVAFPGAMFTTQPSNVGKMIRNVFLIWSANMNLVINRKGADRRKREWTLEQYKSSKDAQEVFIDIAWGSDPDMVTSMRSDLILHGFMDQYDNFRAILDLEGAKLGIEPDGCSSEMWNAWFAAPAEGKGKGPI